VKIVVGLGNPGARYSNTRHNIGARIVECFAAGCGIALTDRRFHSRFGSGQLVQGEARPLDVAVLLPETYMNRSGDALADALAELSVESVALDLLVVFDDLDLPFGQLRIRPGGGSSGHRGLESVIERLGGQDFPRLRFGIGRPETPIDTIDWVLQVFSEAEEAALEEHVPRAVEGVQAILIDGIALAMNRYNRSPDEEV
jgi:PTH1 family peptidyl-tRNA hydrolase